jgi:hypothetical protein
MPLIGGKNAKKKSSSSSTKRHFTVVMGNKEHGLYVSSSPSSAARKAVSKLCAEDKKRKVQFSIREITQRSKKKTYGPYLGYIEKLAKPIELKGRVIKYKPVAKLSGKTGAKKGGMRGGGEIIVKNFRPFGEWIEVKLQLNNKEYICNFFKGSKVAYSQYYFFNKTTNRYMNKLDDYVFKGDDIGNISQALRRGDEIVIRMYEGCSVKELLGQKATELSKEELAALNKNSIIPKEHNLVVYPSLQVSSDN